MPTPRPLERSSLRVPLSHIQFSASLPRRNASEASVEQLAESIRLHGQLSPVLVRERAEGGYLLVAGARRVMALRMLKRSWAEAIVLTGSDCDCALIALVENMQREALHFLDVAAACRRILDRYPITQERLAASLSCSPSALANRLRLLKLPTRVQAAVRNAGLSERHARALLRLTSERDQMELVALAEERRLSVKELERRVEARLARPEPAPKPRVSAALRDNRIVVNALMDTVRRLARIGVPVTSRVEEGEEAVTVIVTIPYGKGISQQSAPPR